MLATQIGTDFLEHESNSKRMARTEITDFFDLFEKNYSNLIE